MLLLHLRAVADQSTVLMWRFLDHPIKLPQKPMSRVLLWWPLVPVSAYKVFIPMNDSLFFWLMWDIILGSNVDKTMAPRHSARSWGESKMIERSEALKPMIMTIIQPSDIQFHSVRLLTFSGTKTTNSHREPKKRLLGGSGKAWTIILIIQPCLAGSCAYGKPLSLTPCRFSCRSLRYDSSAGATWTRQVQRGRDNFP